MSIALSLLAIVISLIVVIGFHEAGHAYAAYLFKVKIKRISIGFGRPLLSWHSKSGCQWVWAMVPLGGYVHLLNSRIEPISPSDYNVAFDKKPIWVRLIILFAGAFANFLIAWCALVLMFMLGYQQTLPIIKNVKPASIASAAGLQEGDKFLSINGENVPSWRETGMQFVMALGQKNARAIVEDKRGVQHEVQLNLRQWRFNKSREPLFASVGIIPDVSIKNMQVVPGKPWYRASEQAFSSIFFLLHFFIILLKQLIVGAIPFTLLLGPIGLFTVMVDSFFQGLAVFLYFIATLSISVAFINLFPIPGLDGGGILYALLEKIRGKPLSIPMEILIYRLISIAFCLLLVQLLLNDMQRYL